MSKKSKTPRVSYKAKYKELEAQLAEKNRVQSKGESLPEKKNKVPLDDLIPLMSLLPYPLVLTTRTKGQGKVIKFESFGEVKLVLYQDLIDILEVSRHFMENGYYIILDERVIKAHGLQDIYSKILDKEKIESILSGTKNGVELYKSCNPEQRKIIVTMIREKMVSDPESVDLNMVDKLSRESGINISQSATEAKEFLKRAAA